MKLALVLLLICRPIAAFAQQGELSADEFLIFKWVNQERARYNLPVLKWNEHLRDSARKHSALMAEQGQMSHQLPGEPKLMDRVAAAGARMDRVAENVAYGEAVLDIWESWLRSPPHRENILNPQMNAIGVGLARQGTRIYATQNFAHTIEASGSGEAGSDLGRAVNRLRSSLGLPVVEVSQDPSLNSAACAMAKNDRLDPSMVPRARGTSHYVVFTAGNPENLPKELNAAARETQLRRLLVGDCFATSHAYPGGIHWVAVAY